LIYHLLVPFSDVNIFFNVFKYITFRTVSSVLTALAVSFFLGPLVIRKLSQLQIGQQVRLDGPQTHLVKSGTPTMGGILIIGSVLVSSLLWARLDNMLVWTVIFITASFGTLGFIDDYMKVVRKNSKGVSAKKKMVWQSLCACAIAVFLMACGFSTELNIPFFKTFTPTLGLLFIPFVFLVVVGASNAVNLTDGLDGLAIGPVLTTAISFIILSYVVGHYNFAHYLNLHHVKGAGELAVVSGAVLGAGLGFLWYNSYPAQMFMGDVGSLALGGAIGTIAVLTKNEILLVVIGGVFVIETLSVILQVAYFKCFGKRIFRMAPLHHHYELKAGPSPKLLCVFGSSPLYWLWFL
jgi:phospho-N-acetylmuramoyl-pentapeptide-transferase